MNVFPAKRTLLDEARAITQVAQSLEYAGWFQDAVWFLRESDTIWFTGLGKSGLVAQRGASMMRTIGRQSQYIHPVDALHGDLGGLVKGDIIIALSHSGETPEVLEFLDHALSWPVIGICKPGTALAAKSTCTLAVDVEEQLPTVSCAAQSAWIDALVVALAPNVEQVLQETHPSGDIGRRLRDRQAEDQAQGYIQDPPGTAESHGHVIPGQAEE